MLVYTHIILALFIFISCGGDTSSIKGLKKSSNTNINISNYSDLEKLRNEAKTRSITIHRNVSKDFIKTELPKHQLSTSYTLLSGITCKDLREYSVLMKGSGDFYKSYIEPYLSVGCTDINHINTNHSGDGMLILAYGENISERNSSLIVPPNDPHISSLIDGANDYYKDPSYSTRMIEKSFDLIRIKGESTRRTRRVLIMRNVTKEHYKNNVLDPDRASTSYDISSNDITCKKISSNYIFRRSMYEHNLITFPNQIIKDYYATWSGSWCKEWDLINAPQSGKKSFLLTY